MRRDAGYATLSVVGLMTTLSLLAVGYSGLSTSKAKQLLRLAEQIEQDVALEAVFYQTVVDVLNRERSIDGTWGSVSHHSRPFDIRLQLENLKYNLNRMTAEDIGQSLKETFSDEIANPLSAKFLSKSRTGAIRFSSIAALREHLDGDIALSCLRNAYTIYQSTAIVTPGRNGQKYFTEDGTYVRLQIFDENDRGLETTLLLTGRKDDPFWIMDWERVTGFDKGACDGTG